MNILKSPTQFMTQVSRWFQPRNEQERQEYRIAATVIALVATLVLLYHYFT